MPRKSCLPWLLLFAIFSLPVLAQPQPPMRSETVRLHNKPAGDIIPLIQPFLLPDAAVSGENYLIIIKTTDANMKEIKEMIANLDTPIHQLLISISFNPEVMKQNAKKTPNTAQHSDKTNIRLHGSDGSDNKTKTYKTHGEEVDPDLFTLRALEDRWATIRTGQSLPMVERHVNADGTVTQSVRYRQVNSGFYIKPRLHGDQVTLEISAFDERQSKSGGGKLSHYVTTSTVSAGIDRWIPLSAKNGEPLGTDKNGVYKTKRRATNSQHIFLKVEVIP